MVSPETITVGFTNGPVSPSSASGSTGACVTFVGRTRPEDHPTLGRLTGLTYTAHEPLALDTMRALCEELVRAHTLDSITLRHAIGDVPPGEASVEVVVHAAHRTEAFSACEECMHALKARVPIWKKETFVHGEAWSTYSTPIAVGESTL